MPVLECAALAGVSAVVQLFNSNQRMGFDRSHVREARKVQNYPIAEGPGALRLHLQQGIAGRSVAEIPPVVLITPPKDESREQQWSNLRHDVQAFLGTYHNRELLNVVTQYPERYTDWPNPDFYAHDLQGVPTMLVMLTSGCDSLHVWVGGCHLLPGEPILKKMQVLSVDCCGARERGRLLLWGAGNDKPLAIPVEGLSDREIHGRMMRLAALAIKACVVKMMDCFYLTHRPRYDEAFDRLVEAEGLVLDASLVAQEPLALEQVRDPAYHLLYRSRRRLQAGQTAAAEQDLVDAFNHLLKRLPVQTPLLRKPEEVADALDRWPLLPEEFGPYLERLPPLLAELPDESAFKRSVLPRMNRQEVGAGFKKLRKMAKNGDSHAQTSLGYYCFQGFTPPERRFARLKPGKPGADLVEAARWFERAAEQGQPDAQFFWALCQEEGLGTTVNPAKAKHCYRQAAEQGQADAQARLGLALVSGGVATNEQEGINLLRKAADQASPVGQAGLGACFWTGMGVRADRAEAVRWFRQAAEQGDGQGQYNLGKSYLLGEGVNKDPSQAALWFRRAAEQGLPEAQFALGNCCADSVGQPQDHTEAVRWYRLAAEHKHAGAQNNLGKCYLDGTGVERDPAEAVRWFRAAADQGQVNAQTNLGHCFANGWGVDKDWAEAARWFSRVAELYRYGRGGVAQDRVQAARLYRTCAENGDTDAAKQLEIMKTKEMTFFEVLLY